MNKNNYLNSLKYKIRHLPEIYTKEILEDYQTHFQEGLLAGKTENDIANDLGDVDIVATNIISEYHMGNPVPIDNENFISKAVSVFANIVIGTLNLLVIVPSILSIVVFVISIYILDFALLITPLTLIANILAPTLPIKFELGTDILSLKILAALIFSIIGYYLYKLLKKYSPTFFLWAFRYIIKSIKFQAFTSKKPI